MDMAPRNAALPRAMQPHSQHSASKRVIRLPPVPQHQKQQGSAIIQSLSLPQTGSRLGQQPPPGIPPAQGHELSWFRHSAKHFYG